jgi:hypothetical protein
VATGLNDLAGKLLLMPLKNDNFQEGGFPARQKIEKSDQRVAVPHFYLHQHARNGLFRPSNRRFNGYAAPAPLVTADAGVARWRAQLKTSTFTPNAARCAY